MAGEPLPKSQSTNGSLGTMAVFMTAISTILGAILFLRFGYAVAHVGLIGTLMIILIGQLNKAILQDVLLFLLLEKLSSGILQKFQ